MLTLHPVTLKQANSFVQAHHRHHRPARGCKFCLGVSADGELRGVAVVARPVSRMLDDGLTAEVVRVATDGARNACSMLLGAAWRACKAMGYHRLVTYTLPEEGGASLRGAGWRLVDSKAGGGEWSRAGRPRQLDAFPTCHKARWQVSR